MHKSGFEGALVVVVSFMVGRSTVPCGSQDIARLADCEKLGIISSRCALGPFQTFSNAFAFVLSAVSFNFGVSWDFYFDEVHAASFSSAIVHGELELY